MKNGRSKNARKRIDRSIVKDIGEGSMLDRRNFGNFWIRRITKRISTKKKSKDRLVLDLEEISKIFMYDE